MRVALFVVSLLGGLGGAVPLYGAARSLSLDGEWQILFDRDNVGREAEWFLAEAFASRLEVRPIVVPSAWELVEQDYEGVAFYRRSFEVPGDWDGRVVRLQFDAVNYRAEVWLNDEVVGFHEGGFTPFEFRVDGLIRPGEMNTLTLRVVGPIMMQEVRVDGMGRLETPQWRGGLTAGIWQSVRLVATGDVYVRDVFIEPSLADDTATLHVEADHTGVQGTEATLEILVSRTSDPSRVVARSHEVWTLHPGVNRRSQRLSIPGAARWSPAAPHLYRAQVVVTANGQRADEWSHHFGMRELTVRDGGFQLNGEPIFVKAAFLEGLYPRGIAVPDSVEMARQEIRLAKEAGFNMIRPWRRPPVPWWLDLADEMGVMVIASPAVECMTLPVSTPYLASRVEHEIRQTVQRDRNRASVVQWELFNELHRPILKQMMRPMAMMVRDLDPTRLILDESGGWAFGANLYLPGSFEPTRFNDIHTYPGPFLDRGLYDGFLAIGLSEQERRERGLWGEPPGRNVVPGLMSFVSELGYGSLPDLGVVNERFADEGSPLAPAYRYHRRLAAEQKRMLEESGFGEMYPDLAEFVLDQQAIHGAANRCMIEAARSNPRVKGYCVHALVGGDWVLGAGLLDIWRSPKGAAYHETRAANQPRVIALRVLPRNIYAGRKASVLVTGINDLQALEGNLHVEITEGEGDRTLRWEREVQLTNGVSRLLDEALETADLEGSYDVHARFTTADGVVVAEGRDLFDVFSARQLVPPSSRIAVLDPGKRLQSFLKSRGIAFARFDERTERSVPVLATRPADEEPESVEDFERLTGFARTGGTVAYVDGLGRNEGTLEVSWFPFRPRVEPARGLWTGIPHLVHDHPIFDGLPSGGAMRDLYQNVWATRTLRDLDGEAIVASIGFDWFSPDHALQYLGPGRSWWGADLAMMPHGEGGIIVSELRLIPNLGKDPVADRLLFNLIRFLEAERSDPGQRPCLQHRTVRSAPVEPAS